LLGKGPQGANCTECLWNRNRLRKRYFWPVRVGVRHTGISLGYLLNEAVVFKVILYDFVRWVEEGYYILRLLVFAGIISVSRNQSKRAVRRPKKAERPCFDVDDLVNILDSLWTDDDSIFIHVVMRTQITFLLQAHCFSGARIGAFLHNSTAEVKGKDGQIDRLVFEGLTWKVRRYRYHRDAASGGLTAKPGRPCLSFPSSRWLYRGHHQNRATLDQE